METSTPRRESDTDSVEFQFKEADFIAAYQLHGMGTRRTWLIVIAMAIVIFASVSVYLHLGAITQVIFVMAPMCAGGVLGAFAVHRLYLPWQARRCFENYPLSHLDQKLQLQPDGIFLKDSRAQGTLLWKDFIRWRTNSNTTLIYTSPTTFLHFPTRLEQLGFPIDRLKRDLLREIGVPLR